MWVPPGQQAGRIQGLTAATPGRRLGRYHLVEPLGGGPCGEVYRAKVVGVAGMERQLAVKRFHPPLLTQPGVSARLSQAARTYGGLDHPRLARLAELGVAGGETFTAVEWVAGLDLARLLTMAHETGSPLPAGASLGLISAAARAVGYAHGRGVCHLGLSPTNLIATPDGDVKVTDVGILACRLPARPAADPALAGRLAYLAPEQLIGEPVSAATDVFALGVIAYELVAGGRPFEGATPFDLEQAVLSGRPAPLELPRPLARVIDRCLARSPFERFPDARALADALDAALRLSPLAGGKRDVAERVTAALEHIARINEQQLSGALSFAVPSPPSLGAGPGAGGLPLPPPAGRTGSLPAIPPSRPRPPSVSPPAPPIGHTLRGAVPPVPRVPTELTGEPTLARPDGPSPAEIDESHLAVGDDTVPRIAPMWPPTEPVPTLRQPPPPSRTRTIAVPPPPPPRPTGTDPPPFAPARGAAPEGSPPPVAHQPLPPPPAMPGRAPMGAMGAPPGMAPMGAPPAAMPGVAPMGAMGAGAMGAPPGMAPMGAPPGFGAAGQPAPRRGRTAVLAALGVVALAGLAVGAFFAHRELTRTDDGDGDGDGEAVARAGGDAGTSPGTLPTNAEADATTAGAIAPTLDAAAPEVVADAAAATPELDVDAAPPEVDAGAATPPGPPDPGEPGDDERLVIRSTPSGARVFLDGGDQGKTPVTLAASADRFSLAVVLPGHDLHLAEIAGRGEHTITLRPVSPPEGPAGIKVRCKEDDRYYVYLDDKPTGQLCPTERLGVEKGEHEVEVYDLVSETRRRYTARVKETRVSVRVRVD